MLDLEGERRQVSAFLKMRNFLFLFFILLHLGCIPKNEFGGGVCLSFDDNYLEEWVNILPLFEKYDAKATFFITGVGNLSTQEVAWLKQLKDAGHEIGSHGELHLSMNKYIKEFGLKSYWEKEIKANLIAFQALDIFPKVFAYPYGEKNFYIDALLLTQFDATRNVAIKENLPNKIQEIFYRPDWFQYRFHSLGIDNSEKIGSEAFKNLLERVKENNEIIFLHAHQIGNEHGYEISPEKVKELLDLANNANVKFYTFSEILNF